MDKSPPDSSKNFELREQDKWLPIANVSRIMKNALPESAKVSKEAKECVQECVSEFVSFITSEASEKCSAEKRKTVNGEDILFAMTSLGFENYAEVLKIYLAKYREFQVMKQERDGDRKPSGGANTSGGVGSSRGGGNGGGSSASVGLEDEDDDDMDSATGIVMDNPSSVGPDGNVTGMLNTDPDSVESNHHLHNPASSSTGIKMEESGHAVTGGAVSEPNGPNNASVAYATYDETAYANTEQVAASTEEAAIYEDYGQYTNVDMNQF